MKHQHPLARRLLLRRASFTASRILSTRAVLHLSTAARMPLTAVNCLELPATADMHVHLRQDKMMELITPQLRRGGVDTAFVMPNLIPPVTTVARAREYQTQLQAIEPNVKFLMSLYLHSSITPEVIAEAAAAGITGVKMYPQGVTTNSAAGVSALDDFFPVFKAMEEHDLTLNLHGEVPNNVEANINELNAEEAFLPTLIRLNQQFPKLRIILEHCSTKAAVDAVLACSSTVAATITAHHLYLTTDQTTDPFAFCKPLAKSPADRDALIKAVVSGNPKFFFGSDSAPHPVTAKVTGPDSKTGPAAGVYTQSYVTQYVLLALEDAVRRGIIRDEDVAQDKLEGFLSKFGRQFYKLPETQQRIVLERKGEKIPRSITSADGSLEVVLSRAGDEVFSLRWK
ncbi:hypothetical protein VTO42DRAFT_6192 [Malbranchea cinnamomea]